MKRAAWHLSMLLLLLAAAACGDDDLLTFEGQPGQAATISISAGVPLVDLGVGQGAARPALLDTGSPLTVLLSSAYPALGSGPTSVDLAAFGLRFPGYPVTVLNLFGGGVCANSVSGLVGGDLLRHFRLGLDYRGQRGFLFYGDAADPVMSADAAAEQEVKIRVLGGGLARLSGHSTVYDLSATRLVMAEALVEGKKVAALVDTGASLVVVNPGLLASLGQTGRPSLCCETVSTMAGHVKMKLTRLRQLRLGPASVDNLAALVLTDSTLLDALSREVGQQVQLLVGGNFLRHYAVKVDYQGARIMLGRYRSQDHVDPREYVGPGFSFCRTAAGEQQVLDVYQGTDASAQGVQPGDLLQQVDGTAVKGMQREAVLSLLRKPAVGVAGKLTFTTAKGTVERQIKVEQLLADYN